MYGPAISRAEQYAGAAQLRLGDRLGYGYDGIVFATGRKSVVKALRYEALYVRERDVYRRLENDGVHHVGRFMIPRLINADDRLWVLEMTTVSPPFALDFAGAYLDEPPDYPEEVYAVWLDEKREQFGDDWPEVQSVMRQFAAMGIYLADVKPGNITVR